MVPRAPGQKPNKAKKITLSKNVQNVRSTCMASEGMTDITLVTTSSDLLTFKQKGKRMTLRYIRGVLHLA